jgi:orotate phosphoribosyltransferase-like protein
MTTATDPRTDPSAEAVTEPLRVLYLKRAGFATGEIAKLLSLSKSTVLRRLREASEAEISARWRRISTAVMFTLLTASAVVIAAAMATQAWGG